MKTNYHKFLLENLPKTLERRTRIKEDENLGNQALYNLDGKLLYATNDLDLIEENEYLSEILGGKLNLVMCGGGHIGLSIYKLASFLDWKVTIVEDREEYCNKEKYPNAKLMLGDYKTQIEKLDLSNSAVVIATRGHKNDKICLEAALLKKNRYLGMIGSKTKVKATLKNVEKDIDDNILNIEKSLLKEIFSPIGLDIKAQTPEEIAISIVAEIIKETKGVKKQIELDLDSLKKIAKETKPYVIARIIEKKGSAPREVGSFLAVFSNNTFTGTVGGGAVEAQVIEDSKNLLNNKKETAKLYYHRLSNDKASKLGMICGGDVKVLLTKFNS